MPVVFTIKNEEVFALAGLWYIYRPPEGEPIHTCTIVTTDANKFAAKVHNRMPVVLSKKAQGTWMDQAISDVKLLSGLLKPFPEELMEAEEVTLPSPKRSPKRPPSEN